MKLFARNAPFRASSRESAYRSCARRRAFVVGVLLFMVSPFRSATRELGSAFWRVRRSTREQAPCHLYPCRGALRLSPRDQNEAARNQYDLRGADILGVRGDWPEPRSRSGVEWGLAKGSD